jgi:hypothetical protein
MEITLMKIEVFADADAVAREAATRKMNAMTKQELDKLR